MNMRERGNAGERTAARILRPADMIETAKATGFFRAVLRSDTGEIVWEDEFKNTVMTGGKNDALDKYFAGSAYTAAWYMGLVDGGGTPAYNAADTMASHAGWTENTGYSNATRPAISWNAAASGSKASTGTVFNMNASGTIAGVFLTTVNTKGGTTGILYSAGAFGGGNMAVQNLYTLTVTWTGSL